MRVRFTVTAPTDLPRLRLRVVAGDEHDLPDRVALSLIAQGIAVAAAPDPTPDPEPAPERQPEPLED